MHERRIPEWIRHPPAPGVRGFAMLAGAEAVARGMLISVFPLCVFKALQDAHVVSEVYFIVGLVSLGIGLLVPYITRFVPRRWVYICGVSLFISGNLLAILGSPIAIVTSLFLLTIATVVTFVCLNAYVLDYISKIQLSQCETSRMFYSALGWTIGPVSGVLLYEWWTPAVFLVSALAATFMLGLFLYMRLGNGRLIVRSRPVQLNALAFLPRFFAQPRLITGWSFAVIRSCGWWVYVIYLPIFAIENGLGERLAGIALSMTNGALFLTPYMLRWMQRHSLRHTVQVGFTMSGILFSLASIAAGVPWITVFCLVCGSLFLILLDISAGLPFLLAVKPSERTEMSAVYSSFRDVAGVISPGAAWLVLLVLPISGIFIVAGASLLSGGILARRLHPRLGAARVAAMPGVQQPDAKAASTLP